MTMTGYTELCTGKGLEVERFFVPETPYWSVAEILFMLVVNGRMVSLMKTYGFTCSSFP